MKYAHILAAVMAEPWAILPEKLHAIEGFLSDQARGVKYDADEIQAKIGGQQAAAVARRQGAVAVLPIVGTISQRMGTLAESSGGISTERIAQQFRSAMADESVKAIIFDLDSPGGSVSGVAELASEIFAARGKKPVIAVANSMAASAAYWIAAQADEVVVTPSGGVGSIGVYMAHVDVSGMQAAEGVKTTLISAGKHKTEANPFEPLSDEARATLQAKADAFYGMFTGAVRRGRGNVESDAMQGRMYLANEAVRLGLADRVATIDETIARFGGAVAQSRGVRADAGEMDRMRLELELLDLR